MNILLRNVNSKRTLLEYSKEYLKVGETRIQILDCLGITSALPNKEGLNTKYISLKKANNLRIIRKENSVDDALGKIEDFSQISESFN